MPGRTMRTCIKRTVSCFFVELTVANRQLFVTSLFILSFSPPPFATWHLPWQYCHYVAGLVGIGLSRLFSASELEDSIVGQDTDLANSMGLFLQKTNIIRDYLEDQMEGREFWPREVRKKNLIKSLLLAVHLGNNRCGDSWLTSVCSSLDADIRTRWCHHTLPRTA